MLDLRAFSEQILEARIGILAMLDVFERFPRRILLAVIPSRKIVWVL
jgi:hypothetical protein